MEPWIDEDIDIPTIDIPTGWLLAAGVVSVILWVGLVWALYVLLGAFL